MPTQQMVGQLLDGRYKLLEIVGEGGMGVVFKATQLSVNRDVAIKVMKSELFEEFDMVRRFKLEMEIISSLQHPNIVRLLDTGQDKTLGVFFLVMEFVEGVSLGHLIYDHPSEVYVKPALALEIAVQICGALTEPHRLGVIHRDLKPDNIILMIRSDEQLDVKLLDFGVARIIEPSERIESSQASRLTATGGIVGTPPYIAPELCESSRNVSIKSDLYAVGALLFELLTGRPPFLGRSTAEVFYKHVHEPAPLLLDTTPSMECPCEDLEELIAHLLAKDPDDRPESALHVKRALDKIRRQNKLARPMLSYSTKPPTVASFYAHIGTVKERSARSLQAHVHTFDSSPPPLAVQRTESPRHNATLPQHDSSSRDSGSLVHVDHTHSMEIPRAMIPVGHDELTQPAHEDELPVSMQRSGRGVLGVGLLVGIALLVSVVFLISGPSPVDDGELAASTPPDESEVQPSLAPPAQDVPAPETLVAAVTLASSTLGKAINRAASDLPVPNAQPVKSKRDSSVRTPPPAQTTPPPQKKPKNNIDWLYND